MKKHLRLIFGFIFAFLIIIVSCIGVIPVKADSNVNVDITGLSLEYGEYNYLVSVIDYNSFEGGYIAYVIAHIVDDNLVYTENNEFSVLFDYGDFISGNYLYLINGSIVPDFESATYYDGYNVEGSVLYSNFINNALNGTATNYYNDGYTNGTLANNDEIARSSYDKGYNDGVDSVIPGTAKYDYIYDKGLEDGEYYYQPGQLGYQQIYNEGAQSILDTIGDEENPNFLIMFKVIINFIRDFFLVGMDVNIFGINIGQFCLGVFMLSLFMMVLNFFRG